MKRLWLIGIVIVLALAACSGGDNGQDAENNDTQPQTQTDDESESAPAQSGSRSYEVTIIGDADGSIPPGSAQVLFYPDAGYHELFFGDFSNSVFFVLPAELTAGEYELMARDPLQPDVGPVVETSIAVDPESIAMGVEDYDEDVSGTLSIDTVGETVSGNFDFTASCDCEDENEEEIRKTIEVTGTFSELPIREGE